MEIAGQAGGKTAIVGRQVQDGYGQNSVEFRRYRCR
jgi:hypothetical protein